MQKEDSLKHYYKFRSLQNLRYFVDVLVTERLYAARYDELNDPMEGLYMVDVQNRKIVQSLREQKSKIRICSLTKDYKHSLMWAHYADGHAGCCIEVTVKDPRRQPNKIVYDEGIPKISNVTEGQGLLIYKSPLWRYEEEWRCFREQQWCNINVHQVILGLRVSQADYNFYKKLVGAINSNIPVRKIQKDEIEDGFIHKC